MKKIYLGFAFTLLTTLGFAQTKIGVAGANNTPDVNANAILELDAADKGLLLPRLALEKTTDATPLNAHVAGMTVYNTSKVNDVVPGFYYNDGTKWQQMVTTDNKAVKFFYMPSIVFDTSTVTANNTKEEKNLYAEYTKQFGLEGNAVGSTGAPMADKGGIPHFPNATDLYYYVTDYDNTIFDDIVIDENGKMTYKVIGTGSAYSIMNIVFVVK